MAMPERCPEEGAPETNDDQRNSATSMACAERERSTTPPNASVSGTSVPDPERRANDQQDEGVTRGTRTGSLGLGRAPTPIVACPRRRPRRPPVPDPDPSSPWVSMPVACGLLHCGRSKVFELIAAGRLDRVHSPGARTCVSRTSVTAYLNGHTPRHSRRRGPSPATLAAPDPATILAGLAARRARLKRGTSST